MYGQAHTLTMAMEFDGNTTYIRLNDTTPADGISEMYRMENMEDGDHQLLARVDPPSSGDFLLDHFECARALAPLRPSTVC